MAWLLLVLTLLTSLANFADFLFGDDGKSLAQSTAYNLYFKVEQEDWSPLYKVSATLIYVYAACFLALARNNAIPCDDRRI